MRDSSKFSDDLRPEARGGSYALLRRTSTRHEVIAGGEYLFIRISIAAALTRISAWLRTSIVQRSNFMRALRHHYEYSALIHASAAEVFERADDHARLSSHMSQPSWTMGGNRMKIGGDESRGRTVGSRILIAGRVFGIQLCVEEEVVERNPPFRKVWETVGNPRLLVIGHYRMGFDVTPKEEVCSFRVFIEYALPDEAPARWLARLFGSYYARWCTRRMVDDAVASFSSPSKVPAHPRFAAPSRRREPVDFRR
jgi:hypothetical protein